MLKISAWLLKLWIIEQKPKKLLLLLFSTEKYYQFIVRTLYGVRKKLVCHCFFLIWTVSDENKLTVKYKLSKLEKNVFIVLVAEQKIK